MTEGAKFLSPFVYWAQTETQISLKIDLKDVKVSLKMWENSRLFIILLIYLFAVLIL